MSDQPTLKEEAELFDDFFSSLYYAGDDRDEDEFPDTDSPEGDD